MKILISIIFVLIACCLLIFVVVPSASNAEEDSVEMYVTASLLNGRASPSKKASKEARFDKGDLVTATGQWSKDHNWVEIVGGETGTVWCDIRYLTERETEFTVISRTSVKIRKCPVNGRLTGYLKKGKTITIDQVVLGWGHCSKGWINLDYVDEEDISNEI